MLTKAIPDNSYCAYIIQMYDWLSRVTTTAERLVIKSSYV